MTALPSTVRIGSRKSRLAQKQAQLCQAQLTALLPEGTDCPILTFQTTGDAYLAGNVSDIGNKGLFTKEIEAALLRGDIDIAVHSMKDVATLLPPGLVIPAMLKRDDVRDTLLCKHATTIDSIRQDATLGTSSLRRAVQIRYRRPDLAIVTYRGNLDRRIARLEDDVVDASLLATAGLDRLAITLDYATPLDIDEMLPAVAQGAIGLQCRADNTAVIALLEQLNHLPTFHCITTERIMLRALDGTCRTPIAGYATIAGKDITLRGLLANVSGTALVRHTMECGYDDAKQMAIELAEQLRAQLAKANPA